MPPVTSFSLLVVLGVLLSGCETPQSGQQYLSPAQFNLYTQRCSVAGAPGTDAFVNCLMSFGLNRETATQVSTQYQFPGN